LQDGERLFARRALATREPVAYYLQRRLTIAAKVEVGLSARRIYQDLVEQNGFRGQVLGQTASRHTSAEMV
jgi:hypothetical protein